MTLDEKKLIVETLKKEHSKHPLGVCLRHDIHVQFHTEYGSGCNTVEQFLDFAELQALEQRTMKMSDWIEELDNQILLNRRKILEGNGEISHEEAIKKAEKEFQIYRKREMKELQSDFDLLMKSLPDYKD